MKLIGDSEQTRGYFKKIAKLVHPDKNGHPLANTVFQKLSNATQLATSSFAQKTTMFKDDLQREDLSTKRWWNTTATTTPTTTY